MRKLEFERIWQDLKNALGNKPTIYTLVRSRPNKVTSFSDDGIEVMTHRSSPNSHLVPRWMFETAVNYLLRHGSLLNSTLLNELNVKRSTFVMAALSELPYITHTKSPLRIFLTN